MNVSNLRSRGFLLVLFPLACQFIFVWVLLFTLSQMQTELLVHSQSRRIVSSAHQCTMDLLKIFSRAYFDQISRTDNMMNRDQSRADAARLKKPFYDFLKMLREDPAQMNRARALEHNADVLAALHQKICQTQEQGWQQWESVRVQYEQRTYSALDDYLDNVSSLISSEEKRQSSQPLLSSEFRTKLTTLIGFSVALSVSAAIALAIVFAKTIRDPLKHVSENSRRMTQRQKLLPLLSGSDEIAELDKFLHTAAEGLETELLKEQSMVDNAPNMICTFDADSKIVRINPASERLLGKSLEELVQAYLYDMVVVDDLTKSEEEFEKTKRTGEGSFDLRLKRRNGTFADTRWECLFSPATAHVFAVVRDVTQEKNVERLKQDFLDMITHDLRSPLTSIHASMTLIDEGVRGEIDSSVKQEVGAVIDSVEHLIEFVNDVLDFQKLKAGRMQLKLERVRLDSMMRSSVELLNEVAQSKNVSINIDCPEVEVECDRSKMIQVMTNLLSNAIRFSPTDSSIEVNATATEGAITVHVLDNGSGIPEDMISKIFEAFEQVASSPKSSEGTGLGLAISKLIVEAHGGTIEACNRTKGSDFWFSLPRNSRGS